MGSFVIVALLVVFCVMITPDNCEYRNREEMIKERKYNANSRMMVR